MNAYEAYILYLGLKLHFTSKDYDYFKYNGKVKADAHSFESRRDRYFFEKLAKHRDVQGFLVSNLVSGSRSYIRDLVYNEQAQKAYADWLKIKESLGYIFKEEISQLKGGFNENFICKDRQHPNVLRQYLGHKISLETLCILCNITGCMDYWNKQLKGDVVYEDVELLVRKYIPFLQFDKEKFKKIIRSKYKEM